MSSGSAYTSDGGPGRLSTPHSLECMVRLLPSFVIRGATVNPFLNKDTSAFFAIIYSAKSLGHMRAQGVPSLVGRIVGDATTYFLIIFTSQILVISFEIFAPVSDHPVGLCSSVNDMRHVGTDSTPSREVSCHLRCCNRDNFD